MSSPVRLISRYRFGAFELDAASGELHKAGISIKLRLQAVQVLVMLAEHGGQVVTREEIRERLWSDDTFVDFERSINFCINQIRSALGDDAEKPRYVETLPRRGYRFIASVTVEPPRETGSSVSLQSTTALVDRGASEPGTRMQAAVPPPPLPSPRSRWNKKGLVAVSVILASLVAGFEIHKWASRSKGLSLQELRIVKLTDSGTAADVAISPDGRYVVYVRQEGERQGLWLRQVATRSDVQILPPEASGFHGVSFSPDGNYIYFVQSDPNDPFFKYLYSMPTFGGAPRKLIEDVDSPVSFSPNGQEFAYEHCIPSRNDLELIIASADTKRKYVLASLHNASCYLFQPGLSWSPDGRTIAVTVFRLGPEQKWELEAASVVDGTLRELYSSPDDIGRPTWLLSGTTLLIPHYDRDSNREQLWTTSFPRGETRRLTNDLSDYGTALDITRDGGTIAAIARTTVSNVWVAPASDPLKGRQITSGGLAMIDIVEASDGKLLSASADGKLWRMNSDGSGRALFAEAHDAGWLTACGHLVVFASYEAGAVVLTQVNSDGSNPTTLVSGNLGRLLKNSLSSRAPACSPDGKFVFYITMGSPQKIWRIPTDGGTPVEIADNPGDVISGRLSISPNGKFLAYPYDRYSGTVTPAWKLAVLPVNGGQAVKIIEVPGGIRAPLWSPDGNSLQYLLTKNGATNLWEQSLLGGKPKQLTRFASGEIFDFNWTADGKRLLLTRGEASSDVVLLSNIH